MITDIGAILSKTDCLVLGHFFRKYIRRPMSGEYLIKTDNPADEGLLYAAMQILELFNDMVREEERYE